MRLDRNGSVGRLTRPSAVVEVGDALSLPLAGELRSLRIAAVGARRGSAAEAQKMYALINGREGDASD